MIVNCLELKFASQFSPQFAIQGDNEFLVLQYEVDLDKSFIAA